MTDTFDNAQIDAHLKDHPAWTLNDGGQLERELTFKDFSHAMLFANAVGHLAEALNHHPDILIHGYKNVRLTVMSHDVGGITARDFRLIALIDDLPRRG